MHICTCTYILTLIYKNGVIPYVFFAIGSSIVKVILFCLVAGGDGSGSTPQRKPK